MRLLDRLLIWSYVKAYLICLVSLLSLYIVVDLFTNLEDFAQRETSLVPVLETIAGYYGYRVSQIFDRLCEAIVLLAAMFTVAWVQRNNELLPLLSAGVPTRRVVRPVLLSTLAFIGLGVANQEFVIPRIASELGRDRDDPQAKKDVTVQAAYDVNGVHVEGVVAQRADLCIKGFFCTIPEHLAHGLIHLSAREARYVPFDPADPDNTGGWLMTGTTPTELDNWNNPAVLRMIDPGRYFLHTREVDFDVVTRNRHWSTFASTWNLHGLLQRAEGRRLNALAVQFHMRLTRPLLGFLLVLLGLALILRDQNRNVFIGAAWCLMMCAVFFVLIFLCKALGDNDYLSPALAAWLPVLLAGPPAVLLFNDIHT
jgi:lipopolysaccharide export system permease protein